MRTMLIAVAVCGALCAWFAGARRRADKQDALVAKIRARHSSDCAYFERWGPQWLTFLGADRFRRTIVAGRLELGYGDAENNRDDLERIEELLQTPDLKHLTLEVLHLTPAMVDRLGHMRSPGLTFLSLSSRFDLVTPDIMRAIRDLPRLESLNLQAGNLHPNAADLLGEMCGLRELSIGCGSDVDEKDVSRRCVTSIAKLSRLERLHVGMDNASLTQLARLSKLRIMRLYMTDEPPSLASLPALPALEVLDLSSSDIGDDDISYLAGQPRLRVLNLAFTDVTSAGLANLASLKSLEEVTVDDDALSIASLSSLAQIVRLGALHVCSSMPYKWDPDYAGEDAASWRRAFDALRAAKPGLIIDDSYQLSIIDEFYEPPGEYASDD